MRATFKYRIYPTKAQVLLIEEQLREACELYNAAKQERVEANIDGLTASMLAREVSDAGWRQFLFQLTYKAESAGRQVVAIKPHGTSQTCTCGNRVAKKPTDRWHHCSACGLSGDRDHISAQVILQRARNLPAGVNAAVVNANVA